MNAADDRSAQSNLATAFTDAKATFQKNGPDLRRAGPGCRCWTLAGSLQKAVAGPGLHDRAARDHSRTSRSPSRPMAPALVLAAFSVPGNCFYIVDNSQALTPAVANSTLRRARIGHDDDQVLRAG